MRLILALPLAFWIAGTSALPVVDQRRHIDQVFNDSKSNAYNAQDGVGTGGDTYVVYEGDGSSAAGWPEKTGWVSYQEMFDNNSDKAIKHSCSNLGLPSNIDTTDEEISILYHAINHVASNTGVDHRFILAIIMQESTGCVRVYTTSNAVFNPGLMQSHAGQHTCNSGSSGTVFAAVKPCPADQIQGMIDDGVGGTMSGDGLAGLLNGLVLRAQQNGIHMDGGNAQLYYQAARQYNSGSIDPNALENGFGTTRCYASDIANRLTGWILAPKLCTLDA